MDNDNGDCTNNVEGFVNAAFLCTPFPEKDSNKILFLSFISDKINGIETDISYLIGGGLSS